MDEIIGRDAELAELTAVALGTTTGSPRFVVVDGAPGIGKSTLLSAVANTAAEAGSLVLRARGMAGESDFAFGVVRQVFELLLGAAPARERRAWLLGPARMVPAVLDPGTAGSAGLSIGPSGHLAAHALFWLTANIARRTRLVIVVDDVQWADSASLRWLVHLSRRLDRLPGAVLAGVCRGEPTAHPELLDTLLSGVPRIRLSGLDAASVTRLVTAGLQARPAAEFVAVCLAETGGNPALLRELMRAMTAENRPPTAAAAREIPTFASRHVGGAVVTRLASSNAHAVQLASAVALLGETELDVAGQAAGLPLDTARTVAAALVRMGVLKAGERVAVRYGLVRHGLLARLPTAERAQLQLRAARALFERCASARAIADHLSEATSPVGERWVAESLREAARTALAEGMPEAACAHLRRLLAEPHEPAVRAEHVAELGAAEIYLDPAAATGHLRSAFVQLREPSGIFRVAHRLACALHESGAPTEAIAVLSEAARRVAGADPDLADALTLHRLSVAAWSQGRPCGVAADLAQLLDRLGHRDSAPVLVSWATALRGFRLSLRADGVPGARVAATAALDGLVARDDLCEPQSIAGLRTASAALLHIGEYESVIRHCRRQAAHAEQRHERLLFGWARALQACAHNALGRYEEGAAGAREALSALESLGGDQPRPAAVLAAVVLADFYGGLGRNRRALAMLDNHPLDGRPGDRWVYDRALHMRARLRLAAGQTSGALADVLEVSRHSEAEGVTNPGATSWRLTSALAHAALGDSEQAEALIGEQIDLARTAGLPGPLAVALVADAVLTQRSATLAEAIGILAGPDCGRVGDLRRQALDLVRVAGERIVANLLELHLRHRHAGPRAGDPARSTRYESRHRAAFGIDSLTAHEQRLIALAVTGNTNDKIAEQFGVSRRAIEFHFTHIYRKLGITGRSQLYPFARNVAS